MTDRGLFVWVMVLCLACSAGIGVTLVLSLARPWWIAIRDRENGPRTVVLRGTVRRRVISLVQHAAFLVLAAPRIVYGQAAPPWLFALAFLVIVAGLIAETVSDMFDLRVLRYMFRERS